MSNIDNEGLQTLEQIRSSRSNIVVFPGRMLNPGEREELEARARRGISTSAAETLAMLRTLDALSRRIGKRFNEAAEASRIATELRQQVAEMDRRLQARFNETTEARQRAENAERALEARGPMADLGQLADAVAGWERAERELKKAQTVSRVYQDRVVELQTARGNRVKRLQKTLMNRTHQINQLTAKVEQYRRDAMERTRVIDKIRQRFNIEPGQDLVESLCRKIGDLQVSEAELVAAPLERRAEAAEQALKDARDKIRRLEGDVDRANRRASIEATARNNASEDLVKVQQREDARKDALHRCHETLRTVCDLVFDESIVAAMGDDFTFPEVTRLVEAVKEIRGAVHHYRPEGA